MTWSPSGQKSDPTRWRFGVGGGWIPPGAAASVDELQYQMPIDFDATERDAGYHTLVSPPGTPAPPSLINYTPDTNEVHAPGMGAPTDKMNLSVIPSRNRVPNPVGMGQGHVGYGADEEDDYLPVDDGTGYYTTYWSPSRRNFFVLDEYGNYKPADQSGAGPQSAPATPATNQQQPSPSATPSASSGQWDDPAAGHPGGSTTMSSSDNGPWDTGLKFDEGDPIYADAQGYTYQQGWPSGKFTRTDADKKYNWGTGHIQDSQGQVLGSVTGRIEPSLVPASPASTAASPKSDPTSVLDKPKPPPPPGYIYASNGFDLIPDRTYIPPKGPVDKTPQVKVDPDGSWWVFDPDQPLAPPKMIKGPTKEPTQAGSWSLATTPSKRQVLVNSGTGEIRDPSTGATLVPPRTPAGASNGVGAQIAPGVTPQGGAIDHSSQANFIRSMIPYAVQVSKETGIPASVLLAIPINEQGWQTPAPGNNYYGIKGKNPQTGASTGQVGTWEVINGQEVQTTAEFRAYDSPADSMRDFARFLVDNPRYKSALEAYKASGNPNDLLIGMNQAGYATDPNWATKVGSIADQIAETTGILDQPAGNIQAPPASTGVISGSAGAAGLFSPPEPEDEWFPYTSADGKAHMINRRTGEVKDAPGGAGTESYSQGDYRFTKDKDTGATTADVYVPPHITNTTMGNNLVGTDPSSGATRVLASQIGKPEFHGGNIYTPPDADHTINYYNPHAPKGKQNTSIHRAATAEAGWDMPNTPKGDFGQRNPILNPPTGPTADAPPTGPTGDAPEPGSYMPQPGLADQAGTGAPPLIDPLTGKPYGVGGGQAGGPPGDPRPWKVQQPVGNGRRAFAPDYRDLGVGVGGDDEEQPTLGQWYRPFGMGQDEGQGWVPPLDPSAVVGGGNKFGQQVSMEGTHKGTDLQAYEGTPVKSPVDGTVVGIETDPAGLGLQVHIQGTDGTVHTLAHLLKAAVKQGDQVQAGMDVGQVGESGAGATGPHLDYRVQDPAGQYINPEPSLGELGKLAPAPNTIGEDGQMVGQGEDTPDGWPQGFRLPSGADPWDRSSWTDADFDAYQQALRGAPMPKGLGFDQPYSENLESDPNMMQMSNLWWGDEAQPAYQGTIEHRAGGILGRQLPNGGAQTLDTGDTDVNKDYMPRTFDASNPQRVQDMQDIRGSSPDAQAWGQEAELGRQNQWNSSSAPPMSADTSFPQSQSFPAPSYEDQWTRPDMSAKHPAPESMGGAWQVDMPQMSPEIQQLLAGAGAAGAGALAAGRALGGQVASRMGGAAAGLAGLIPSYLLDPNYMYGQEVGQGQGGGGTDARFDHWLEKVRSHHKALGKGQGAEAYVGIGSDFNPTWTPGSVGVGADDDWSTADDDESSEWDSSFDSDWDSNSADSGTDEGSNWEDPSADNWWEDPSQGGGGNAPDMSAPNYQATTQGQYQLDIPDDGQVQTLGGEGTSDSSTWSGLDDATRDMFSYEFGDAAQARWQWERAGKPGGREQWLQIQQQFYNQHPGASTGNSNAGSVNGGNQGGGGGGGGNTGGGTSDSDTWSGLDDSTRNMFTAEFGAAAQARWQWERAGKPGGREQWLQIQRQFYQQHPGAATGNSNGDSGGSSGGGGNGGNSGNTGNTDIAPYEKGLLDHYEAQLDLDIDKEENRHNEAQRAAQTTEDQQKETKRHNKELEAFNNRKLEIDKINDQLNRENALRMQGSFAQQQQAKLLQSALTNPWLQSLTGMAPGYGTPGWDPQQKGVLAAIMNGWEPQANILQPYANPSIYGQPGQAGAPANAGAGLPYTPLPEEGGGTPGSPGTPGGGTPPGTPGGGPPGTPGTPGTPSVPGVPGGGPTEGPTLGGPSDTPSTGNPGGSGTTPGTTPTSGVPSSYGPKRAAKAAKNAAKKLAKNTGLPTPGVSEGASVQTQGPTSNATVVAQAKQVARAALPGGMNRGQFQNQIKKQKKLAKKLGTGQSRRGWRPAA